MKKPNIILILADDMGYGDIGITNNFITNTPNIDSMATDGTMLMNHYSGSPVCAPARASLMTGRYPHRTGVVDTLEHRGLERLNLNEKTMGDMFKEAGYHTGIIGKWHLGTIGKEYHPNSRGFDEFIGFRGGWSDYYNWKLDRNGIFEKNDGRYFTDVISSEAVKFIKTNAKEPFFLHVAYTAPHWPLQVPEEELEVYKGKFDDKVSTIYAMISRMDKGIGLILDELNNNNLTEDTIVLFMSDNGPEFSDDFAGCPQRYNANLRGSKYYVYEGGIKVPCIIKWKGVIPANKRKYDLTHFVDWVPTLSSMAKIDFKTSINIDGEDISEILYGNIKKEYADRFYWQWNRYTPNELCNCAVRKGKWKLVRPAIEKMLKVTSEDVILDKQIKENIDCFSDIITENMPAFENVQERPLELFNIEDDPQEQIDLSADYPEIVKELEEDMLKWFNNVMS